MWLATAVRGVQEQALSLICFLLQQVRVAALQNLVKIMSLYYQYMETYMGPALFAVSTRVPRTWLPDLPVLLRSNPREVFCRSQFIFLWL